MAKPSSSDVKQPTFHPSPASDPTSLQSFPFHGQPSSSSDVKQPTFHPSPASDPTSLQSFPFHGQPSSSSMKRPTFHPSPASDPTSLQSFPFHGQPSSSSMKRPTFHPSPASDPTSLQSFPFHGQPSSSSMKRPTFHPSPASDPTSLQSSVRETGHGGWLKHLLLVLPLCLVTLPSKILFRLPTRLREPVDTQQQAQLESDASSLCAAVAALQLVQFLSSSARLRTKHWLLHCCVWVSYYVPVPLAAYALGVMLRFQPPYWLVATLFAAGHTDAMAAYGLHDDRKGVRRFAKHALLLLQLVWLFISLFQGALGSWQHAVKAVSVILGFLVFSMEHEIKSRAIPPSDLSSIVANNPSSRRNSSLVVAVGSLRSDDTSPSGCTTLEDIQAYNRNSPAYLRFPLWMQDISLSSGLFLQLLQRYDIPRHSYQIPAFKCRLLQHCDRSDRSCQNQVVKERLPTSRVYPLDTEYQETGMDAFRLVEVQLSFMFDYFFSAHSSPSITHPSIYLAYSLCKITFLLSICLAFSFDSVRQTPLHVTIATSSSLCVLMLLELLQLRRFFVASKWFLVSYMSNRAKGQPYTSIIQSLLEDLRIPQLPSKLKLGQYSLIEDFDCNSIEQRLMSLLGWSHKATRATYVDLPYNLINATLDTLSDHVQKDTSPCTAPTSDGPSLQRSSLLLGEALAWTCMQETHIHTILIWHVATSYREDDYPMVGDTLHYFGIATKLSRYCAYLVAFLPELLPEDSSTTHTVLQEVLQEAEMLFGGTGTPSCIDEKRRKLRELALPEASSSKSTFQKGIRLGRELHVSHPNQEERWRMVAACWMQIHLFIAPSDNVAAHIQQLAKGGEFLTHLWACLSNLGIVKREMKDDKPNAKQRVWAGKN